MMNDARRRIIETMRERNIKLVNLVMTQEEFAKENGFDDAEDAEDDYNDYMSNDAPYVIFFNKWGNGIDYAALSVELEDGEHPKFKLNCYNSENGSDTFSDYDLTQLSMVNVYERMLEELDIEDEPEKVMVLYEVCEDDNTKTSIVAMTEDDWQNRKADAIEKALRDYFDERYSDCDDDYFNYDEEIAQAVATLTTGYDAEFNGDSVFWDSVDLITNN